jgi:hypothetical protein
VTNVEWEFLATCGFLVFLAGGVGVPYSYHYARRREAERRAQPAAPPIAIERTPQTVVITITLQTATDPPHLR